jgi:hypothetical protein
MQESNNARLQEFNDLRWRILAFVHWCILTLVHSYTGAFRARYGFGTIVESFERGPGGVLRYVVGLSTI